MGWRGAIAGTLTLAVVLGGLGVGAVAAFTVTGVNLSGSSDVIGGGSAEEPFMAKGGFVRNDAPWRLEIVGLDLDGAPAPDGVRIAVVSRDRFKDEPPDAASTVWHEDLRADPLGLRGDRLSRALWISVAPGTGKVVGFSSMTVTFRGPLGLEFSTTTRKVRVLAFSAELSDGIASMSPLEDRAALAGYMHVLQPLIAAQDAAALASAMGPTITVEEAADFLATQPGAVRGGSYRAEEGESPLTYEITFETADGATPNSPFRVAWSDNRWTVVDW